MNEEKILLPDFLIADLYKNSLVELVKQSTKTVNENKNQIVLRETLEAIKFLGDNGQRIIIVVEHNNEIFLPENDLVFLTNVLKACALKLSDIAIVNIFEQKASFVLLKEQLSASKILLFAVKPSDLGLPFSIPDFQVHNYDGCSIMVSPALAEMNDGTPKGKELKVQFWTSLKKMFGV